MANLGTVYRLSIRERGGPGEEPLLLGSIDNAGTRLCDVLPGLLKEIYKEVEIEGHPLPQPSVTFKHHISRPIGHHVAAAMNHHEYGSRGVLHRYAEGDETPFGEIDNQQVTVGLVISAPPERRYGFLAVHVPNRRGIKTEVEEELRRLLHERYNCILSLEPLVPTEAIEEAIEHQGLGEISFLKLENPSGLFSDDDSWWSDGQQLGTAKVSIRPARSERLFGSRLARFIRTRREALSPDEEPVDFSELATLKGETYEELTVEIYIRGRKKKMRIGADGHSFSHAFSYELGDDLRTDEAIVDALTDLLPE